MAVTTTNRSTLNITFHTQDGSTMGGSYTWKFNYPAGGASSSLTLDDVKAAFDLDGEHSSTAQTFGSICRNLQVNIYTKEGNIIDGIDSAAIVTTTTTKNELS